VKTTLTRHLLPLFLVISSATSTSAQDFAGKRQQMVADIDAMIAATGRETGVTRLDDRVRGALFAVPRHEFVPPEQRTSAYRNRPLPIGERQTISQPFIVALMTELLQTKPTDKVLEIGTGSGYQSAILSMLVHEVYTIEIIPALGRSAQATLDRLGYSNVQSRIGDGYLGWPEHAPFDAIILTAAPDHIPPALIAQLRTGGRLVAPVGVLQQVLLVVTRNANGTTSTRTVAPVHFVPLTRD